MSIAKPVWLFDGEAGRLDVMLTLVARYLTTIDFLVPEEYEDPMVQLAVELAQDYEQQLAQDPSLARLFPPAMTNQQEAIEFRRDAIGLQARVRLAAARSVLADLSLAQELIIEVPIDRLDDWLVTLAAIRAQWNVELTGDGSRMAAPTEEAEQANPAAAAVCDWVGYLIEDAVETLNQQTGNLPQ